MLSIRSVATSMLPPLRISSASTAAAENCGNIPCTVSTCCRSRAASTRRGLRAEVPPALLDGAEEADDEEELVKKKR